MNTSPSTTAATPATLDLQVTRRFTQPAGRVFDAWLTPASAARWLFATPGGSMVRAEIDARVGGKFVFTDRRDGADVEHAGEYLEIAPPRRLLFTFTVPKFSSGVSRIGVDIAPLDGGCELTLTHYEHPAEFVERSRAGWGKLLAALAASLG